MNCDEGSTGLLTERKRYAGFLHNLCPSQGQSPKTVTPGGGFFEELEHTADVALRFGGPDLETFFGSAAQGMYCLLGVGKSPAGTDETLTVALEAIDIESLVVDWLSELAFQAESYGLVFATVTFHDLTATRIEAELTGKRNHSFEKAIKAVTYHHLSVDTSRNGYETIVVFDV